MFNKTILFVLIFLGSQFSFSQELKNNKLNLSLGSSFFGPVYNTHSHNPAFLMSYDRRLNLDEVYISSGLNVAHQQWLLNNPNLISLNDTIDQFVSRTSLGLRLLLNYRTSKKLKLYSGLRFSFHIWNLYDNHNNKVDLNYLSQLDGAIRIGWRTLIKLLFPRSELVVDHREQIVNKFGLQVLPIAANYSLGKYFDLNAEIGLFGPYYFSTGFSYNF